MAMKDVAASERLRREVRSQYEAHRGERFTKTGLAALTGHSRPTLDKWLVHGYMPDAEGMVSLADAVGVQPARLWVKWLDLSTSDPLVRIADALERAYPPDHAAEKAVGTARAQRAVENSQAPGAAGLHAKRSAPPSIAGSGR